MELNQNQLGALKELSSTGALNAAMSLSELLKRKFRITMSKITLDVLNNVPSRLGGAENIVNVLYMRISGQILGSILLILPLADSLRLADVLTHRKVDQASKLDEMGKSALKELGNITAGSYLSTLSQMTDMKIIHSVPRFATDMLGALLDGPLADLSLKSEYALIADSEFVEEENVSKGHLIFIPDPEALRLILRAFGNGARGIGHAGQ